MKCRKEMHKKLLDKSGVLHWMPRKLTETNRNCAAYNAAHGAKYVANQKAMHSAEISSCPPRGLSLQPNSVDSVVDFYNTFEIEAPGPSRGDRGSLMLCCVCKRVYPE